MCNRVVGTAPNRLTNHFAFCLSLRVVFAFLLVIEERSSVRGNN